MTGFIEPDFITNLEKMINMITINPKPLLHAFIRGAVAIVVISGCSPTENPLGLFQNNQDVGPVGLAGSVEYDQSKDSYLITGGGENMWFDMDGLHYVYNEMAGDLSLAADIEFVNDGGNAHKKAGVMIRQDLDTDAAYADLVIHIDGHASLQYRAEKGAETHTISVSADAPNRLRVEKNGSTITVSIANTGEEFRPGGATLQMEFTEPFFVGLGICAHDSTVLEQAIFTNVKLDTAQQARSGELVFESAIETISVASGDRRVIHYAYDHFESPHYTPAGDSLIYNAGGHLYKIPVDGGVPKMLNTGSANGIINDHGYSPDGQTLVISDTTDQNYAMIYTLPAMGGEPKLLTQNGPSYWHGWSPDGQTLTYTGGRNGEYDVYTISVNGGKETRLTDTSGNVCPEYSADGEYIYFQSDRTGLVEIYKMKADGSEQEQITDDEYHNWWPHPSPDGKWVAFLSYDGDVEGHGSNVIVRLRLLSLETGNIQELTKFSGGQGSMNVPSWSPDSQRLAYVSHRMVGG